MIFEPFRRPADSRSRRSVALSALSLVGAAGLLAACSSGRGGTASTTSNGAGAAASSATTLSTHLISGVGTVLVDQSGKTVYTPDQEFGGTIHCTAGCLSFWFPVTVASSVKPTLPGGITGTVGTIQRPDNGQMQVTYNGKPLYTFRLDPAPGDDHGQNFKDSFSGTSFTWRAISTSGGTHPGAGASASSVAPAPNPSSGYGSGYDAGNGTGY